MSRRILDGCNNFGGLMEKNLISNSIYRNVRFSRNCSGFCDCVAQSGTEETSGCNNSLDTCETRMQGRQKQRAKSVEYCLRLLCTISAPQDFVGGKMYSSLSCVIQ